jgi:hypothetical protein
LYQAVTAQSTDNLFLAQHWGDQDMAAFRPEILTLAEQIPPPAGRHIFKSFNVEWRPSDQNQPEVGLLDHGRRHTGTTDKA